MNKKNIYINIALVLLISISIIAPFILFLNWNAERYFHLNKTNSVEGGIKYSIDDCSLKGNTIIVTGWATLDGENKAKGNYILTNDKDVDKLIVAPKQTVKRKDVSAFFGKKGAYDDSGFRASIKTSHELKGKNQAITIVIKDDQGKVHWGKYDCKL